MRTSRITGTPYGGGHGGLGPYGNRMFYGAPAVGSPFRHGVGNSGLSSPFYGSGYGTGVYTGAATPYGGAGAGALGARPGLGSSYSIFNFICV